MVPSVPALPRIVVRGLRRRREPQRARLLQLRHELVQLLRVEPVPVRVQTRYHRLRAVTHQDVPAWTARKLCDKVCDGRRWWGGRRRRSPEHGIDFGPRQHNDHPLVDLIFPDLRGRLCGVVRDLRRRGVQYEQRVLLPLLLRSALLTVVASWWDLDLRRELECCSVREVNNMISHEITGRHDAMRDVLTLWLRPLDLFVEQRRLRVQRRALVAVKVADVMCRMQALCVQCRRRRLINIQYIRRDERKGLTMAGSSSYTARSMSLICSSCPSGAQVTDLLGFPFLVNPDGPAATVAAVEGPAGGGGTDGGGVADAPVEPYDFSTSSNGLNDDGCATFGSGSFFIGAAGGGTFFLKLGISFFAGFGFEKNDESDFASLTTAFASFFTAAAFGVVPVAPGTAAFFAGGAPLAVAPSARRFLLLSVSLPRIFCQ